MLALVQQSILRPAEPTVPHGNIAMSDRNPHAGADPYLCRSVRQCLRQAHAALHTNRTPNSPTLESLTQSVVRTACQFQHLLNCTSSSFRSVLTSSAVRRHYEDMAALRATDQGLADHYLEYGRREGRVAQRLRVVLTYDAAALESFDTAHDRVSGQLYSLIGTMAIALRLGAEMVRVKGTGH